MNRSITSTRLANVRGDNRDSLMFDVGFSELALIAIVALVVLGPERLPEAARALGKWVGRARRMMRQMSEELEREVDVSDLRQQFRDAKRSVEEEWEEPTWHQGESSTYPSDDQDAADEDEVTTDEASGDEPEPGYDSAAEPADENVETGAETVRDGPPSETDDDQKTVGEASDTNSDSRSAVKEEEAQSPHRDHSQSRVH